MTFNEFGMRCEACHKYKKSRMYYKPVRGISGKYKDIVKWRRLCCNCWLREEDKRMKVYNGNN